MIIIIIIIIKCKTSTIGLIETACIFLIFLTASVQISLKCEKQNISIHANQKHTYVGIG